jgi:[protein-PII] uridylyltransferase
VPAAESADEVRAQLEHELYAVLPAPPPAKPVEEAS